MSKDPRLIRRGAVICQTSIFLLLFVFSFIALASPSLARSQSQAAAPQPDVPAITYRRVFKGSSPEFVEIVVRQDGAAKADVRQLSDPASPQDFQVAAAISRPNLRPRPPVAQLRAPGF